MPKNPTQLDEMIAFLSSSDAALLTPEGQRQLSAVVYPDRLASALPADDEGSRSSLGVALRSRHSEDLRL